MNRSFTPAFLADFKKLKDKRIQAAVNRVIDRVEAAKTLSDLANLQSIQGFPGYFRIRVGDFRIGFRIESQTVVFMRCGHRREIYRVFP